MNRKALEQKDHVKYLRVLMNEHLKCQQQINNVSTSELQWTREPLGEQRNKRSELLDFG